MNNPLSHTPILTIGYGTRSSEEFLKILKLHNVSYLIDIRSYPQSKYNPNFSKDNLSEFLERNNIKYVFMGKSLGGRPEDPACYTDERVDYEKMMRQKFYNDGIARLNTAWNKNLRVVLMCSECKPQDCHRSKLIGRSLRNFNIDVLHIDEHNNTKTQDEVLSLLESPQISLLGSEPATTSRKRYARKL